ncbi:hypothetical protein LOZ39_003834 [Ophidiomyces ophidiicola]|nr:hypothetical protein LOZ49_002587 [Ophidiomyces ophidiicola]KAI2074010.1 hypothetical protein LOZ39_003834 [Ophidiomyces ophidiicola]KAI2134838.1 hypothetical protein LOZ29_004095 [Ophidiomyces ophidiicola]KAI2138466.1 hypothetical protein LOZ28_003554 [Ophidiomyces ophidiicola]KAI2217738.1 hypothetical protein LOZ15_003601 [Ophidiomyces ophidiicola]
MERPDISIVAVELNGHKPPRTMVLRGENMGPPSPSSKTRGASHHPPMRKAPPSTDRPWEYLPPPPHNGSYGVRLPPSRGSERGAPARYARRDRSPNTHHAVQPPSQAPSIRSGSEYSAETRDDEPGMSSTTTTTTPADDDKAKSDGDSQSSASSSAEALLPVVKVDVVPPLTKVHFACYQSHRSFMASKNAYYSVPCMTCLKTDQLARWRCTFCSLRVCGDCAKGIGKCKDRSLMEFLEHLVQDLEGA